MRRLPQGACARCGAGWAFPPLLYSTAPRPPRRPASSPEVPPIANEPKHPLPAPRLPPQYELHRPARGGDVLAEAGRLARDGAEEGTLVWSDAADDGFRVALVLRPERPAERVLQLVYVALMSLGRSVAELLPWPMAMRFRWPGRLLLGDDEVGRVGVLYPGSPGEVPDWLVLDLALEPHVPCRDDDALPGESAPPAQRLLERFARHFLAGINRWDGDGFATIRREWLTSAEEVGDPVAIVLAERRVRGTFVDIDGDGALVVDDAGRRSRVPLSAAFPPRPTSEAPPDR